MSDSLLLSRHGSIAVTQAMRLLLVAATPAGNGSAVAGHVSVREGKEGGLPGTSVSHVVVVKG
jgi:hypothetical protein